MPQGLDFLARDAPGLPAGLDLLWREHGRRPWPRLVEPALRLARDGVPMPAAHAAGLRMLAPVMTMREGEAIYAPVPMSLSVELDARGHIKSIDGDTPDPAAVADAARYI